MYVLNVNKVKYEWLEIFFLRAISIGQQLRWHLIQIQEMGFFNAYVNRFPPDGLDYGELVKDPLGRMFGIGAN